MQIRDTFATKIEERINPVVKVADRDPVHILEELTSLVITPQWEQYLHRILQDYTDNFDHEDEQDIGIWISGFFGSGKSLLMKVLGVLLEGGEVQSQEIHQLFLNRLPGDSRERTDLERFLAVCRNKISTTFVGGNVHAKLAKSSDSLALIVFRLFAEQRGYTNNWPFAWSIEYQIDARGLTEAFRRIASQQSGQDWTELVEDADFYSGQLYDAAAQVLPDHFNEGPSSVARAVQSIIQSGITPDMLIDRLCRWCRARDSMGKRHKLLLQLDELGQWIGSTDAANSRAQQVQALVETASIRGQGCIWIAVTAHGEVQALKQNIQQEVYEKVNQRFSLKCKLSNEDINQVVQQRLLRKTEIARKDLRERFHLRSGTLIDLGSVKEARRVYPSPNAENIAQFYPYLPWTVAVIPDVVKGIAQATGREEALTGSNRTMIGVVQGGILDMPGFLDKSIGHVLCLADLYKQVEDGVPTETKTDLSRIVGTVKGAGRFTLRVAQALFLLDQSEYIPCNIENVARALIDSFDADLVDLSKKVEIELERLVEAGYAKQVGAVYTFLTTQERSFQEKVRERMEELLAQTWLLSQHFKKYDDDDALRFDRVSVAGITGREKLLRLEIDNRPVRNPSELVTMRVYSPLQYILDSEIMDDEVLKQRSLQESNNIIFRMADVRLLRRALALAVATAEVVERVMTLGQGGDAEREIAKQIRQKDLPLYETRVRQLLAQAVRSGLLFFRGSAYDLIDGESAREAVRNTLSFLLPKIYARFNEVSHRVLYEETAIKAALSGNTSQSDLQALGVYSADGTLNENHPLLSALRGRLPQAEDDRGTISADQLRSEFERPPFGWDRNCIKIGLALLLRNATCRFLVNNHYLTDPSHQEAVQALTKEQRFKALRVQGMRSELSNQELIVNAII
jgi:hypothetical protein